MAKHTLQLVTPSCHSWLFSESNEIMYNSVTMAVSCGNVICALSLISTQPWSHGRALVRSCRRSTLDCRLDWNDHQALKEDCHASTPTVDLRFNWRWERDSLSYMIQILLTSMHLANLQSEI